jgi:hypothetical protein
VAAPAKIWPLATAICLRYFPVPIKVSVNSEEHTMASEESNASIADWLKERGYSQEQTQKILAKLAQYDDETMRDAIFDSIGGSGKTLDEMISDLLRD